MDKKLEGMSIAIVATDDFEEVELVEPKKALEDEGASVVVIAPHSGEIQAMRHDEKINTKVPVNVTLDVADPDEFDAVMLPGGALNADQLRVNDEAQEFVAAMDGDGKPVAVICHAPWLLVSADLVEGRTLTSYFTIQDDVRNAGGEWQDKEVVIDENWISSRQPNDIPSFNKAMIDVFAQYKDMNLPQNANAVL